MGAVVEAVSDSLRKIDELATPSETGSVQATATIFKEIPGVSYSAKIPGRFGLDIDVPCPIVINVSRLGEEHLEEFKQIVAHEIFHCFQRWNFGGSLSWPSTWWFEGSANHFSNLVYPSINVEHPHARLYQVARAPYEHFKDPGGGESGSPYATTLFFQSVSQHFDDVAFIKLLRSQPLEGDVEDMHRALSQTPLIDDIFHRFVEDLVDRDIEDTGGGMVPFDERLDPVILIALPEATFFPLRARSFRPIVYSLFFDPGKRYTITMRTEGAEGRSSARVDDEDRLWEPVPKEIITDCHDSSTYFVVLTSTTPPEETEPYTLEIKIEEEPRAACGCVKPGRSVTPADYGTGTTRCFFECEDQCWCRVPRPMWEERPATLEECNPYYPRGTDPIHPEVHPLLPPVPTHCEAVLQMDPPITTTTLIGTYCSLQCSRRCGGIADPPGQED